MILNPVRLHVFYFPIFYLGSGSHKEKIGYRPVDTVTSTSGLIYFREFHFTTGHKVSFLQTIDEAICPLTRGYNNVWGRSTQDSPVLLHLAISKGDQVPQQLISSPVLFHLALIYRNFRDQDCPFPSRSHLLNLCSTTISGIKTLHFHLALIY